MYIKSIGDTHKTMIGKSFLASNGKYYKPRLFFYCMLWAFETTVCGSFIVLWPAFTILFGKYLLIFTENIIFLFLCSAIILFLLAYVLIFFLAFLIPLKEVRS
jgi:hypothetical protein